MITRTQRTAPPAPATVRHACINASHRGSSGLWLGNKAGSYEFFAPFSFNPGLRPDTIDGQRVEFEIGEHRGRPVAVNVTLIRSAPET